MKYNYSDNDTVLKIWSFTEDLLNKLNVGTYLVLTPWLLTMKVQSAPHKHTAKVQAEKQTKFHSN